MQLKTGGLNQDYGKEKTKAVQKGNKNKSYASDDTQERYKAKQRKTKRSLFFKKIICYNHSLIKNNNTPNKY